jgi:glycine betaine/choline ABC-type transport system substrate-binding protein
MRRIRFAIFLLSTLFAVSCGQTPQPRITVGSKFFTEQVILAEFLAQHIEARTGIPVIRKTNLGGTLLVHKALLAGELDLYVEYTGTALTAVLNETPQGDSKAVYGRVRQLYSDRFHLEVTEPLGFENTFAMVIRGDDARKLHLQKPRAGESSSGHRGREFHRRAD